MKNLFFPSLAALFLLGACGPDQETVNKMADEMCEAMALITDDPMSLMDAATKMGEIMDKTDEYGNITEEQLIAAMEERCPDGASRFKDLSE
ncbi:MAG TPA: hypothetical protein DDX98_15890 [Bacteroidales bacterium]|nr:hypothetical protein [Bacteroidales bacterium]